VGELRKSAIIADLVNSFSRRIEHHMPEIRHIKKEKWANWANIKKESRASLYSFANYDKQPKRKSAIIAEIVNSFSAYRKHQN
jgi:hypothetical protein